MLLQENLDTWILPLRPFLDQICHQFMQAVFMICVVGGNLSSGAAMKYSYIIGWHERQSFNTFAGIARVYPCILSH